MAIVPISDGIYEVQQRVATVGWVVVAGGTKVQSWFLLAGYQPPSPSSPNVTTTFLRIPHLPTEFSSAPTQIQGAMVASTQPVMSHVPIPNQIEPGHYALSQGAVPVGSLTVAAQAGTTGVRLETWELDSSYVQGHAITFAFVDTRPALAASVVYRCTTIASATPVGVP
jgi:hypothetical protein